MPIEVRCTAEGDGYRCAIDVSDMTGTARYLIQVSRKDFDRWGRGRSAEKLVRDSFNFLLEREPRESILKEFDLSMIQRYFPDYDGA
jgi:hypothetical protein